MPPNFLSLISHPCYTGLSQQPGGQEACTSSLPFSHTSPRLVAHLEPQDQHPNAQVHVHWLEPAEFNIGQPSCATPALWLLAKSPAAAQQPHDYHFLPPLGPPSSQIQTLRLQKIKKKEKIKIFSYLGEKEQLNTILCTGKRRRLLGGKEQIIFGFLSFLLGFNCTLNLFNPYLTQT